MVFPDDVSGAGDFMKRPGMRALLAYLDAQPDRRYVVIFDDLKRFARDIERHLQLRREFAARSATVECLNFQFEDTPEGQFIESIIAAQGQLEREQNRRQVLQKMKARVENGFWVFRAPVGYKHVPAKGGGGKVLVPDEPLASVVREALEGYAYGRFTTQSEVKRFLESDPHFPKDRKDGTLRPMTITRLLKKVAYAGYVEAPKWGVSVREGQHEGLISFETYQRIQDNLEGRKRAPAARADYHVDFPLRGFVACNCCGNAMTAAWSTGMTKRYPYYRCETRGCEEKSKCIPRAKLEDGFEAILRSLAPSKKLFEIVRVIFADVWEMRSQQVRTQQTEWKLQLKEAEKQIEELLDRLVDTDTRTVAKKLEERIDKLERDKFVLAEKASKPMPTKARLEECMELALKFLSSPWSIYKNGSYAVKQTVLKLAFAEPPRYCRINGYGTIETSFPFKVLGSIAGPNIGLCGEMVLLDRIELSTSPLPRECSTTELQQHTVSGLLLRALARCKRVLEKPFRFSALEALDFPLSRAISSCELRRCLTPVCGVPDWRGRLSRRKFRRAQA